MSKINELMSKLSDKERSQVLDILNEISSDGKSDKFQDMLLQDYDEIPVDIETFLTNNEYLGSIFDGGDSIYPFWKDKLSQIFDPGQEYNEIVLTGAIGLGKTTIALIGMLYVLYNLLCLKNPQVYYGLPATSKIVFAFFNITLDLSFGVAYNKLQDYLKKSPWFLRNGTVKGVKNKIYVPGKNIEFRVGSKSEHGLGQDIFCLAGSTEIKVSDEKYCRLDRLYDDTKNDNLVNIISYEIWQHYETITVAYNGIVPTKKVTEVYKVLLEDGTEIVGDGKHQLLLSDYKYKDIEQLQVGDQLHSILKENK